MVGVELDFWGVAVHVSHVGVIEEVQGMTSMRCSNFGHKRC